MGFFGTYVYDGNDWYDVDPDKVGPDRLSPPSLWINVHDSDFAQISYAPAGPGTGTAYLGESPEPTDAEREAFGIAYWLENTRGPSPAPSEIRHWLEDEDDEDGDPFVENKVRAFLAFLGLSVPDGLA